jgi:hypothetical protein
MNIRHDFWKNNEWKSWLLTKTKKQVTSKVVSENHDFDRRKNK